MPPKARWRRRETQESLFTLGGADGIENAMKMHDQTGRQKS
jgi:hypothetical protein